MKYIFLLSCLLIFSCQKDETRQFSPEMEKKIFDTIKRDDITGRIHLLYRSIDSKNWEAVKEMLADKVEFDEGDGVSIKSSEEIISHWQKSLSNLDGTQHVVSNYGIEVNKHEARLMFIGTATHYKKSKTGKNIKTLHGSYEVHMSQPEKEDTNWAWKITKFKYINNFTANH